MVETAKSLILYITQFLRQHYLHQVRGCDLSPQGAPLCIYVYIYAARALLLCGGIVFLSDAILRIFADDC